MNDFIYFEDSWNEVDLDKLKSNLNDDLNSDVK